MIKSDTDKSERGKDYDNYIPTSSSQTTSDGDEKEVLMIKYQNLLLNIIEKTRPPYLNQVSIKNLLFDIPEKDNYKIPKSKLQDFLEILDKFPIRNPQKEITNLVNLNSQLFRECLIHIRLLIVGNYVIKTKALFDIGIDQNYIP